MVLKTDSMNKAPKEEKRLGEVRLDAEGGGFFHKFEDGESESVKEKAKLSKEKEPEDPEDKIFTEEELFKKKRAWQKKHLRKLGCSNPPRFEPDRVKKILELQGKKE